MKKYYLIILFLATVAGAMISSIPARADGSPGDVVPPSDINGGCGIDGC